MSFGYLLSEKIEKGRGSNKAHKQENFLITLALLVLRIK